MRKPDCWRVEKLYMILIILIGKDCLKKKYFFGFINMFFLYFFFSILAETVDRNNKKYQSKFKKMEHQMFAMVEKHTIQVNETKI